MSSAETGYANEKTTTEFDASKNRVREQLQTGLESVKTQLAATGRVLQEETLATGQVLKEEAASVAQEKLEQARKGTADALSRAARGLESRAGNAKSTRYREAAEQAAHRLEDASQYVRAKSIADVSADLRSEIAEHPGRWICAALTLGFLTGVCYQGLRGRASLKPV